MSKRLLWRILVIGLLSLVGCGGKTVTDSEDQTPPAQITDLAAEAVSSTSIKLEWTAPGDDGNQGTVQRYEIRYGAIQLNDQNFTSGTYLLAQGNPAAAGQKETEIVSGLQPATRYYFAVKAYDEEGNESPVSNSPQTLTLASQTQLIDVADLSDVDAKEIARGSDFLAAICRDSRLKLVDVSDPAVPTLLGEVEFEDQLLSLAVSEDYAYIIGGDASKLFVVDCRESRNPELLASRSLLKMNYDILVDGNYAYMANSDYGLVIYNVSSPSNPIESSAVPLGQEPFELSQCGDYLYIAAGFGGVKVVDISSQMTLGQVGSIFTSFWATAVDCEESTIYSASADGGLEVIDASNPSQPLLVGSLRSEGWAAIDVVVNNEIAFVAYAGGGLRVIDVSTSSSPTLLAEDTTIPEIGGMLVEAQYLFVATGSSLKIVQILSP